MKISLSRAIILFIALLLSIGAGYLGYGRLFKAEASGTPARSQPVAVRRGSLTATVSTTGSVVATRQAKLTFNAGGRLRDIPVKVGDVVTTGQTLAALDTADLDLKVAQAESTLRVNQLKLDQLVAGSTASDIAAAQSNYDAAVAKLAQLKVGAAKEDLAAAQATYDAALNKYNLLKAGPSQDDLNSANAALDKARAALQKAQTDYDKVAWRGDIAGRPEALALQQATGDYQTALAAYNIKVAGATADQLKSAEAAVYSAKAALDTKTQGATPDQIKAAEASVASAKSALDAKSGPTTTDVALNKEQVRQAEIALQQAKLNLDGATLKAPFEGIVASVTGNMGEQVGSGTVIMTLLDPKEIRIDANIDESEIGRVKVGQAATLTVDALPNFSPSGKVIAISGNATVSQGVVTYLVSISLSQPNDGTLKSGMTVSANVVVDSRENVLLIPNRAIRTVGRQRSVDVSVDGKTEQRPIQVGMANDQMTEVTQGLQEGDLVIISATTTTAPRVGGIGGSNPFGGGGGGPVMIPAGGGR